MNTNQNKYNDGIIVILSYPDTIVRPAYWEPSSKIWPMIGIGGKHAVQAGHAAMLLIRKGVSEINYYDFGRYITSYGNGRVRCKKTDPELNVPIKPKFNNDELQNLEQILIWLDKHPEKTHGEGRLIATINHEINFELATKYINTQIKRKEIPYGAFVKNGSNCSRFVTDTLIASLTNIKTKLLLKKSNLLTPSPIGNVIIATSKNIIYHVENQKCILYKNRSILKEYRESILKRIHNSPNLIGTEEPNKEIFNLEKGTWIGGIGSGAWFNIENQVDSKQYNIARYNVNGIKDFEGKFKIDSINFCLKEKFEFIYPTNCEEMHIIQNNKKYLFKIVR